MYTLWCIVFCWRGFNCCMGGAVSIPAFPPLPNQLLALYTLNNAHSRNFRSHIWLYNNMFAFASMNYNLHLPPGNHNPVFRICCQIAHCVGPLQPPQDRNPSYGQVYIYNSNKAVQERLLHVPIRLNAHLIDDDYAGREGDFLWRHTLITLQKPTFTAVLRKINAETSTFG